MKEVKVSIIMPSLNVESYIEECISSAMQQTLTDIEIISVDAGSTDGTLEILKKCAEKDDRIKLLHSEIKSYGYQVNMGIDIASGKYVAILETDDYIDRAMYKKLVAVADDNELDMVLADYDSFFCEEDKKYFKRISRPKDFEDTYKKILGPKELENAYIESPGIWRGIYSKEFLDSNRIRFNETPGAAYQDIDFIQRVMMHVKRAMYVPESYYRYRTDRDESSVNSTKGLQYLYQEYSILFENNEIVQGFEKRIFQMMTTSFLGEIRNMSEKIDSNWLDANKKFYYWLREKIQFAIEKNYINKESLGQYTWDNLECLIESLDKYVNKCKHPGNTLDIEKKLNGREIVIFGAGQRGIAIRKKLVSSMKIVAFCDNDLGMCGTKIAGVSILSLHDCINSFPNAGYVITVKKYSNQISEQLFEAGIEKERTITYRNDEECRD